MQWQHGLLQNVTLDLWSHLNFNCFNLLNYILGGELDSSPSSILFHFNLLFFYLSFISTNFPKSTWPFLKTILKTLFTSFCDFFIHYILIFMFWRLDSFLSVTIYSLYLFFHHLPCSPLFKIPKTSPSLSATLSFLFPAFIWISLYYPITYFLQTLQLDESDIFPRRLPNMGDP